MKRLVAPLFILLIGLLPLQGSASGRHVISAPKTRLKLILPEVTFDKATLEQAVSFLSQKADVNIVIDPSVYVAAAPSLTRLPPAQQQNQRPLTNLSPPEKSTADKPEPASDNSMLITLHLKNVPLEVVLKYILRYKNLRYVVEDYAIVILPIGKTLPEDLKTEIFRLRTASPDGIRPFRPGAVRSFP
jgi:hypothetical protein